MVRSRSDATEGRRRGAAIAFADVVGYSTLMAADEAGTYRRWMTVLHDLIEPETARHGGRIVDLAGDGVLAEFPRAPDALSWARQVQRGVRARLEGDDGGDAVPIALRIGLHEGEVYESGANIFGDAVNFAARLQAHAAPGGIVVSERMRAALGDATPDLELRDLGYVDLKGFERRAHLFTIETDLVPVTTPLHPPGGLPSIAVLPLFEQGGDPDRAYFADGVVEDIALSLAGLHELFVVSTASSAMFRGRLADPREAGRALGVGYVLFGRITRMPDGGYGIAMQLCDTRSGATLWGERLRAPRSDIFEVQDEIVRQVVAGLAPQVRTAELQRAMRKRPESQTAYDRMLRALHVIASADRDTFDGARRHLAEAMEEEPGFASPFAWAARWHSVRIGRGWSSDVATDSAQALDLATRAAALDRSNALALATLGHLKAFLLHDCDAAMECFEEALAACPNHALAWTLSSGTLSYLGRGPQAVRHAERGLRLSPRDPMRYAQLMFLAIAQYASGDHVEAVRSIRRSASENPMHGATLMVLAASLAATGRIEEARQVGARFRALQPDFSLALYVSRRMPFRDPALREGFLAHLRAAGLPE
ncbi:adenylate/guanylate cyclase domain-containing protein [Neoroseomonas alba]|uniref:adenylate/guanylate cyclase domain-containing protein n=1 Tax=Roseomonas alba TaxID=2846776 RepID=UPI001CA5397D|nr:adenylate/guanylate cyclase domain-containing protein [Neoroseomonas alba]